MAKGLKYPKEMTKDVVVHIPKEMDIRFHDCLRDFAIVPYFGFWLSSDSRRILYLPPFLLFLLNLSWFLLDFLDKKPTPRLGVDLWPTCLSAW